jgi:hypothetical protein
MEGEYRLLRYAGVQHWARVRVVAEPSDVARVEVSPGACRWLMEEYGAVAGAQVPPDLKAAAQRGAMLALAQASRPFAVTVATIRFSVADTSPDDIQFATVHAVWEAIGHVPADPPYIDAGGVHFPPAAQGNPAAPA